jgi:hypothetical protein
VLQTRYCPSDQIEEEEMDGARGTHGEKINAYRLLLGKPEERDNLQDLRSVES